MGDGSELLRSTSGLIPIHRAEGGHTSVDIVIVPGASARREDFMVSNWLWLFTLLSADLPHANLYFLKFPESLTITQDALQLIQALDNERSLRNNYEVPIMFVAHSMGGFIVKQALILLATLQAKSRSRILANTRALLFFAVPHRGFEAFNHSPILRLYRSEFILRKLIPSMPDVERTVEGFAPISGRFKIYTFVPSIMGRLSRSLLGLSTLPFIMGLPNEEVSSVSAPTYKMLVFEKSSDPNYQLFLAILKRNSEGSGPSATSDWQQQQLFRLDGTESESAKQWFSDLRSDVHRVINSRPVVRPSKVAILDTGIDWHHPCFQVPIAESRVVAKSFIQGVPGDWDTNGHGTHSAHLVLKVAPNTKLFIARVIEDGSAEEFARNSTAIVEAIKWAVAQGVDIISMSFGDRIANSEIKAAIRDAFHKGVILVAAASNSGINPRCPISFPASLRQVICIHSSDGNGNPSARNPPSTSDCSLAVLGEAVAAAWPRELYNEREDHLRVASGTSVASPIAAGLAALVIEYAAQTGPDDEVVTNWMQLRHSDEMRKVFHAMARERSGYHAIAPSSLFDYHGEGMHQRVSGKISEVLDAL